MIGRCVKAAFTVAVSLGTAAGAWAETIYGTDVLPLQVSIVATSGTQTAQSTFDCYAAIAGNQLETFDLVPAGDAVELKTDTGAVLGTIRRLQLALDPDPQVRVKFDVEAGASDTLFVISSPVVYLTPAVVHPLATASASIALTDDGDGTATVTGQFGGKAFEATYNGTSVFADLVQQVTVHAAFDSASVAETRPVSPFGSEPIAATVNDIEAQFKFVLTANDSASGTGIFSVTPEPSSWALLGMGLLAAFAFKLRQRGRRN